ncbi:MAG TPA: alcohol dehydrogenase catalytic domain-containing protein [Stellaceae bacterium]|nr:alcohol dehydrogenase catalytic domain-containing protein [Stellaceae bacterium]
MKALVYTNPDEIVFRDAPDPVPAAGEALLEVEAVGICGSDMHGYHGLDPRRRPPLILGHEAAARIIAGSTPGRRVVINPLITCGRCAACESGRQNLCAERRLIGMNRPGAFARLIAIPETNLLAIPDGMAATAAALTEPAATALHALSLGARVAHRPLAELRALILGGGSIGLLSALWLQAFGSREMLLGEVNPLRRAAAEQAGCAVYDPAASDAAPEGVFDLVVDAVGTAATRAAALRAVRPGGIVLHIGLGDSAGETDFRKITLAEISVIGSYTYTPADLRAAVTALHEGKLGTLSWVEPRRLAEGARAFADLAAGRTAAAKIVLLPV